VAGRVSDLGKPKARYRRPCPTCASTVRTKTRDGEDIVVSCTGCGYVMGRITLTRDLPGPC